jgi:hypothetical protein
VSGKLVVARFFRIASSPESTSSVIRAVYSASA